MNVTAFRIWNFMGCEDSDWIELWPVTLLLNSNLADKNAILQALQMLEQSLNADSENGPLLLSSEQMEQVLVFGFKCTVQVEYLDYLGLKVDVEDAAVSIRLGFNLDATTGRPSIHNVAIDVPVAISEDKAKTVIFKADSVISDGNPSWSFESDFLDGLEVEYVWPHVAIDTGPETSFFPFLNVQEPDKSSLDVQKSDKPSLDVQKSGDSDKKEWGQDFNYVAQLLRHLKDTISSFLESLNYFDLQLYKRLPSQPLSTKVMRAISDVLNRQGEWLIVSVDEKMAPLSDPNSEQTITLTRNTRIELHRIFSDRFNEAELKTFCFYLEVGYDTISGNDLESKARELISYFERRREIIKIIKLGKILRPDIAWSNLLTQV